MAESSEDSELAAMLDEGLFPEDHIPDIEEAEDPEPAETADEDDFAAAVAADSSSPADEYAEAQAAKRPRTAAQEGFTHTSNAASAQQHSGEAICPPHPGWWMNMCIRCGAVKQESAAPASAGGAAAAGAGNGSSGLTRIKHLHHRQALEVSADEAARIATDGVNRLLASRRLVLVLDLDHTLLNTVRDCDLVGEERQRAQQQLQQQAAVLHRQQQQRQASAAGDATGAPRADGTAAAAGDVATAAADAADAASAAADTDSAPIPDNSSSGSSSRYSGNPWEPQSQQQQQQQLLLRPRLFHLADKGLWTKLRPGVEAFLAAVSQLYELHIYTMGDKGYAGLMADLLDPQHRLFVGRVISAADSTRAGVKDLDVLLADESLVLILDDTEHVWEKHRANLIQVERYHYFGASARLFHPGAPSPLEQGSDEQQQGGVLDLAAQLLARIHERMFGPAEQQQQQQQQQQEVAQQQQQQGGVQQQQQQQQQPPSRSGVRRPRAPGEAGSSSTTAQQQQQGGGSSSRPATPAGAAALPGKDVRQCLDAERRGILAGCHIVFSRCWPQATNPADHPLWHLAQRLGGSCSMSFERGVTTHVVVAPDKSDIGGVPLTDKVTAAQRAGVPVVHPDWLVACKFDWAKQPEAAFALPGYAGTGPGGFNGGSSRLMALGGAAAAAAEREKAAVMKGAGRTDA
ncbi:hypothetical protein OEZ85_012704 [Tetradesmus obliquus]|uniref:protein-serine/threonine phosphatase n=1 Tax=Tetradesmus obliquus TaxID=3088 RepID=A0ABY8U8J7_TETOB|nr:hypothetical protein OEZ85_012704 [Tetradesmus obliquus]